MAADWFDGFDHYGSDEDLMLDGSYAQVAGPTLQSDPASSGLGTVLLFGGDDRLRKVLSSARTTAGMSTRHHPVELPVTDDMRHAPHVFKDGANNPIVSIAYSTTGVLAARSGSLYGSLLGDSGDPVIVAGAWQHIETKVVIDDVNGAVEVRVNGETIIDLTGLDLGTTAIEQVEVHNDARNTGTSRNYYMTDLVIWDDTGTQNNDFIGDRRVYTVWPSDDTAQADWTLNGAATGHDCINQATPDDDTTYIAADGAGDISEFDIEDLPSEVASIAAVMVPARLRKTDAGTCNVQTSMVSGTSEANGNDRPITEAYTYWRDVFEVDPDTGAPWTVAGFNAAKLKLERTA